ncbi:MAG: NAD(P)-dependent oxidoreductase [Cellvibrionaceae bacterium]
MQTHVAFIGLGVMGYPMAGHLQKKGYAVTVYNRTPSKASDWTKAFGGEKADSPKLAAQNCDVVFCCVGNDEDVRSVVLGEDGALAGMKAGATLVDHTTASAELAKEISLAAKSYGVSFLDAPVSGGQQGAENGSLSVMLGGEQAVFDKIHPILKAYAKAATLIGPVGSGQLCKMVNQICIAGLIQGLSEGLCFANNAELDIEKVISVISQGAAQSWQMENRYQTMSKNEYNHGFAVDWMRKDLGIVFAEAEKNNTPLPVTSLVDEFYSDVQSMGGGRWDTSSLLARLHVMTHSNTE